MRIIAVEVGGSAVRAAVVDVATLAVCGTIASQPLTLVHPTPEAAELPAERVWAALVESVRTVARGVEGIVGIACCCDSSTLVLLDHADRPLGPLWTARDRRGRQAARQAWAALGVEHLRTCGNRPLPGLISAVSYRQQLLIDPYLHTKVKSYLHLNGWLAFLLCGERACDPVNASLSGLFNTITDQQWSPSACAYFEVERTALPAVVAANTTLGGLRSVVAAELGLPAGIAVKLGTATLASAMLAGQLEPGDLLHSDGDMQTLACLTPRPQPAAERITQCHAVGPLFCQWTVNPLGAAALHWLHRLCYQEQSETTFFNTTIPDALKHETRVSLSPAYLGGDELEIDAQRAGFRDLTLSCARLDLLAALLKALRDQQAKALATLGLTAGCRRILFTGPTADVVMTTLPRYDEKGMWLPDAALRGVARLFAT